MHIIAQAAFQLLRDIAEKSGQSQAHEWLKQSIRPGMEAKVYQGLNKAASFLKHADKDHLDKLTADDAINDFTLFFACRYHDTLGLPPRPEINAFTVWFMVTYPDTVANPNIIPMMRELVGDIAAKPRAEQLSAGRRILDDYISAPALAVAFRH